MIQDGRLKALLSHFHGRSLNLLIVAIAVLLLMMAPVFSGVNNVTSGNKQIQATSPVIQAINASNIGYVKNTYVMTNHTVIPGNYTKVSGSAMPTSAVYDPVNSYVYSVDLEGNISVINSTTNRIVTVITIPFGAYGIAYDPNNGLLFIPSYYNNSVSVVNTTTNKIVHTVTSNNMYSPYFAAYDPSNNFIYVTDEASVYVTLINATTFSVYSASFVTVGTNPVGIAYDPTTGFMYVGNWYSGTVTVLNGTSTVSTITVGTNPEGLVYDPSNGYMYVANYGGTVSVINPLTNLVQKTINVGVGPYWAIYDSINHNIYVENQGYNNVTVISGSTNTITGSISTGTLSAPSGGAFVPTNNHIFVTNMDDNTISVINATTNSIIQTINVGETPSGTAYDPYTGNIYVTNIFGNNVTVLNATDLAYVTTVQTSYEPEQVAFDPSNGYLYVTEYGTGYWGAVAVINGYTNQIVKTISTGVGPGGIAYDASNGYIYVANYYSYNLTVINGVSNTVVGSVGIGTDPIGVAYDQALGYIYVTNEGSNTVSIVSYMSVIATVTVGSYPYSVAYDSSNGYIYVVDGQANNVTVLNGATVKTTITGLVYPGAITYDQANGFIYVSTGTTNLSVINGTSLSTTQLQISYFPMSMVYDYENGFLYSANYIGTVSQIAYNKAPTANYAVSFDETGLPSGSVWTVTFNGITVTTNATAVFYTAENGSYSYSASSSYPVTPSSGTVIVNGKNVVTSLSFETLYTVTFSETGLYPGITWSLTFNGSTSTVTKSTSFRVPPGNYSYSIAPLSGYIISPGTGYVNVSSSNVNVAIIFTPAFNITFKETGLPSGTSWYVTLDYSISIPSTTNTITFTNITNVSSAPYSVTSNNANYYAVPSSGYVSVVGSNAMVNITFKPVEKFQVEFVESGLSAGTMWSVNFDGLYNSSTTTNIGFSVPNGTYIYSVNSVSGYTLLSGNGTVVISGTGATEYISYSPNTITPANYLVTFSESGLPGGTYWSVSFGSNYSATTNSTLDFSVPNGTYSFSAYATGYNAYPASGNIIVSGSAFIQDVVFVSVNQPYYNVSFQESGLEVGLAWNVSFGGTYNFTSSPYASFLVQNGTYNFSVTAYGYTASPSNGQLTVSGSNITESIVLTQVSTFYGLSIDTPGMTLGFYSVVAIYVGTFSTVTAGIAPIFYALDPTSTININLPDGTYTILAGESDVQYNFQIGSTSYPEGTSYENFTTINMTGSPLSIYLPYPTFYTVTVMASGLISGTLWAFLAFNENWINGGISGTYVPPVTLCEGYSTSPTMVFYLPSGTYYYLAATSDGFGPVSVYNVFHSNLLSKIHSSSSNSNNTEFNVTNSNLVLHLNYSQEYNLTFKESGLPVGTSWSIYFNGYAETSNTSVMYMGAPNGTYLYSVYYEYGYSESPSSGYINVTGSNITEVVHFISSTTPLYTVNFTETGLPTGTEWMVTINGTTVYSSTSSLIFELPDGSYSYAVGTRNTLYGSSGGTMTVSGANKAISVAFSQSSYTVTFSKTGLPSNDVWYVNITDSSNKITTYHGTGGISISLLDGTYSYTIASANKDYAPSKYHGTFTVNGAGITVSTITFSLVTYKVTFSESGLPSGNTWYVNITGGTQLSTSTSSDNVLLQNGTYSYTVATQDKKYSSKGGSFTVSGSPQQESLTYSPVTYKVTFNETGLKSGTSWSVTFNGASKSSTGSTITFSVQNGTYAFSTKSVTGYKETGSSGNLTINGAQISHTVKFTSTTTTTTPPGYGGLSFNTETLAIIGLFVAIVVIGAAIGISRRKK